MGKMASRTRVKGAKGKRWGKGQSSSSNPQTKKHRAAAKGRFSNHLAQTGSYQQGGGGVPLTTDALASHDAIQGKKDEFQLNNELLSNVAVEGEEPEEECEDEDTPSLSLASTSTAYSLIETAHPVFSRVKRLWHSTLESHREICAVLAAVSEVIKSSGGSDVMTEYFGVLVTALESTDDEKSITAIAYLLSIVMTKVRAEVLQVRYSTVCKVIADKLAKYEMSDSTSLLKSLVSCLTTLLGAQVGTMWHESYTRRVFQTLLNYTIHPKPKLRKVSQTGLASMLKEGTLSGDFHPAARLTATHCLHVIEKGNTETTTLHVLGMLKDCMANMNTGHIKSLCGLILKLISIGNSVMRSTAFKALHGLFSSVAGPQGLTHEDNTRLISDLYDFQPSLVDVQLLNAWLTVMEAAHNRLFDTNRDLCLKHLPKLFTLAMECLMTDKAFVKKTVASLLEGILKNLGRGDLLENDQKCDSVAKKVDVDGKMANIEAMFRAVEHGLKYKLLSSWNYVLSVLATFYQVAGKNKACQRFMTRTLISLCELRSTPNFPFCDELDSAFGSAIKSMGPRVVLNAVPLKLDVETKSCDFPRSWILPVLKDHVEHTELGYFKAAMLPMADMLEARGKKYLQAGRPLEGKLYNTLQIQVWSLLPGFCSEPVDLSESFGPLVPTLETTLKQKVELRQIVCQALKQLVNQSTTHDEDKPVLAQFCKNFLPILFSLYTSSPEEEEEGKRLYLLDCIKAYISITGSKLVEKFFSRLMAKLKAGNEPSAKHYLLDLAVVFVPHLSKSSLTSIFTFISPLLDSADATLQKKAYGCLEVILSVTNSEHRQFQTENLSTLRKFLVESLSTISAGSKKPRLRCLLHMTEHMVSEESSEFITTIIPEVILCIKEVNEKARVLACKLVISLGYAAQRCFKKTPEESVTQFFTLVLAGLAGSTRMVSCTLLALSRLVYEFHDLLGIELVKKLLSSTLVFLSSKAREVVRSNLILIKVIIGILPPHELEPHVEPMVKSILSWGENKRNHFRLKSRAILERLIRKLDYSLVSSFVPKNHQKLIAHIRKMNERHRRKRNNEEEEEEGKESSGEPTKRRHRPKYEELLYSSEEEEKGEDFQEKRSKKLMKKSIGSSSKSAVKEGKAWIKESAEDDPINFMDPLVVKSVVATDPAKMKKSRKSSINPFKTDKEGRLVIMDESQSAGFMEEDSTPTEEEAMIVDIKKGRKRSRSDYKAEEDEDGELDYHPKGFSGGHGIHRTDAQKHDFKKHGSEFKAKKAKGDVKKKGQLDPYAYIPLNREKLNRRKRAKLKGEFSGLMKKAAKGSASGTKQRHKRK